MLVHLAGDFTDPGLPPGYAPFGIQNINGLIYVTYALEYAARHDDVAGTGHGFIDIYTSNGFLIKRLVSRVDLNSPWGLAEAPAGFGPFGGDLVGNFGNGLIHAFGLFSGVPRGALLNQQHKPIRIDDLWALKFGTATTAARAHCCSAPASTTRKTAWSAPSTPFHSRLCSQALHGVPPPGSACGCGSSTEPPSTRAGLPCVGDVRGHHLVLTWYLPSGFTPGSAVGRLQPR